jgi:large subunit ribosomal protein L18
MIKYSKLKKSRRLQRNRRHQRIRRKVEGSAERPRLAVFRSLKHVHAQLVDDIAGVTLAGTTTLTLKDFKAEGSNRKIEMAHEAGKRLAEQAKEKGITSVVFDRGGVRYHGRVKAFAEGAREGGLEF